MDYELTKKPSNVTLITGFPSVGLVSTIATKFLTDHLDVEIMGHISSEKMLPLTAIHKGTIVEPLTLYYNKKYNIVILQSLTEVTGFEWEIADTILKIAKELKTKEIIVLESIPSMKEEIKLYTYSKNKIGNIDQLKEGIIMGLTATLLLRSKNKITCLFAETHSNMPDSEAAAKVVEALDKYLNMKIDFKPLLEQAKKFEASLRQYIDKSKELGDKKQKRELNYFG